MRMTMLTDKNYTIIIIITIIIITIIIIITLFKCHVYLMLRHTNWGHCQSKLIHIKFNQMQVFEERGKPLRAEKRINKLNPHTMLSLEIEPGATLVGREFSHHYTNTALCFQE